MGKFIGSLLIAVVCVYYGFSAADRLRKRKFFLTAFLNSLSFLETEIVLGRYDLKSVFKRINDKKLFGLYTECAECISDKGIKEAWRESVEKIHSAAALKNNDCDAVISLAAELGMSDVEGQKKAIARTTQLAARCFEEADEEYTRLGRVYRSCAVLTGIFAIIIFI